MKTNLDSLVSMPDTALLVFVIILVYLAMVAVETRDDDDF